jgi:hypothetical protein
MFHVNTTRIDNFVFESLFVFNPGWRVGFAILNWRKTEKKTRNGLSRIEYLIYLFFLHFRGVDFCVNYIIQNLKSTLFLYN